MSSHLPACRLRVRGRPPRRRYTYYTVADPRVADLVTLASTLAADNAEALASCVRIVPVAS